MDLLLRALRHGLVIFLLAGTLVCAPLWLGPLGIALDAVLLFSAACWLRLRRHARERVPLR